jgi:hypothetical protein
MNDGFSAIVHVPDSMRICYPFIGRLLDSPSTVLMRTAIELYPLINKNNKIPINPCTINHYRDSAMSKDTYDWYLIKHDDLFVFYGR